MIDHLLKFFVTFLVVVEPIGVIPIFIAVTEGVTEQERRRMARKGVMIAGGIFLLFAFGGGAVPAPAGHQSGRLPHLRRTAAVADCAGDGVRAHLGLAQFQSGSGRGQEPGGHFGFPAGLSVHRGPGLADHHPAGLRSGHGRSAAVRRTAGLRGAGAGDRAADALPGHADPSPDGRDRRQRDEPAVRRGAGRAGRAVHDRRPARQPVAAG